MTEKKRIAVIGVFVMAAGCQLSSAPDCKRNEEKCEQFETLGTGVLSICNDNGEWKSASGCARCDDRQCIDFVAAQSCDVEDEVKCIDADPFSVQFTCLKNRWVPDVCAGKCDGNKCHISQVCDNGERQCLWVDAMGSALQMVCSENKWTSYFCPKDVACHGNTCDIPMTLSCDGGLADCNAIAGDGCEVNLKDLHLKTCTSCDDGFGNCDNDLSNGCEFDLKAAGLDRCSGCSIGDDLLFDEDNCGECGRKCTGSDICYYGECTDGTVTCVPPSTEITKTFTVPTLTGNKSIEARAIKNVYELKCLADNPDDKAYYLDEDIVIPPHWEMIGTKDKAFKGIFIGNGHKIQSSKGEQVNNGIFGYIEDAVIYDLELKLDIQLQKNASEIGGVAAYVQTSIVRNINGMVKITGTKGTIHESIGGIAGRMNSSEFSDCSLNIEMILPCGKRVGGIAGLMDNSIIKNSQVDGDFVLGNVDIIDGYCCSEIGGVVGYAECQYPDGHECLILNTKYNGGIEENSSNPRNGGDVGGIVGYFYYSNYDTDSFDYDSACMISKCNTSGNINVLLSAGGIGGELRLVHICDSYSSMNIRGQSMLGGLAGMLEGGVVKNSYALGNVTAVVDNDKEKSIVDNYDGVGGLIGVLGTDIITKIVNCYSTGNVSSNVNTSAGGFVGYIESSPKNTLNISDCGAFGNVISNNDAGGFVGKFELSESNNVMNIDKSMALGNVKSNDATGGFLGRVECWKTSCAGFDISNSYTLSANTSTANVIGGFIGEVANNVIGGINNVTSCFYNREYDSRIGSGEDKLTINRLQPIVFKSDKAYLADDTQDLTSAMGTGWYDLKCTMDLGSGSKEYTIPYSGSIYPSFCKK